MKNKAASTLVYSTETGRICPDCGHSVSACVCRTQAAAVPVGNGVVRVSRETKGRGGKCVTIVRGLALAPIALGVLGKQLRAACGSGGTVKDGVIEVQGDHCEKIIEALNKHGHAAKRAGG